MNTLIDNAQWMLYNSTLAWIAVLFGWLLLKTRHKLLKIIFFIIWFLFIPNTLYIVTDLIYIPEQWVEFNNLERIIMLFQFFIFEIIGILSFILAIYFFEKMLSKWKINKSIITILIIILNFLIGFGIALGRDLRLNSWDVFLNLQKVIADSITVITSFNLLLLALFFGLLGNIIYFLFRKRINKILKKWRF